MRKLGLSTYTFAHHFRESKMNLVDLMNLCVQHQLQCVQICENSPLSSFEEPEVFQIAKENGIEIQFGIRGIGRHLLPLIEKSATLKSPFLRVVIDTADDEPTLDEAISRLESYVKIAQESGVQIAIENHDRFSADQLLKMVQELGVGIVLDTANSLGSLEGPKETLEKLGPHTVNLHWKPIQAKRIPTQLGFEITGCATNDCPLNLADWLSKTGSAPVIFEQWAPNKEHEKLWFEQSIEILKQAM